MDKKIKFEARLKVMEDIGRALTELMDKEERVKELLPRLASGLEMAVVLVQGRVQFLIKQQEETLEKIKSLPEGEDPTGLENRMNGFSVRQDEASFILNEIQKAVDNQKMNSISQSGKFEGAQAALRIVEGLFSTERVLFSKWEKEEAAAEAEKVPEGMTKSKARTVKKVRDLMGRKRKAKEKKTD